MMINNCVNSSNPLPISQDDMVKELRRQYPDAPPEYPSIPIEEQIRDFVYLYNQPCKEISHKTGAFGSIVCNAYFIKARTSARHKDFVSLHGAWADDFRIKRICRGVKEWTVECLYKAQSSQNYTAANFRPSYARNLFDYYFLPEIKHKRVLDPCAGFGGRLLGFYTSETCDEYVGIDR